MSDDYVYFLWRRVPSAGVAARLHADDSLGRRQCGFWDCFSVQPSVTFSSISQEHTEGIFWHLAQRSSWSQGWAEVKTIRCNFVFRLPQSVHLDPSCPAASPSAKLTINSYISFFFLLILRQMRLLPFLYLLVTLQSRAPWRLSHAWPNQLSSAWFIS